MPQMATLRQQIFLHGLTFAAALRHSLGVTMKQAIWILPRHCRTPSA